jgi:hypothetical protein
MKPLIPQGCHCDPRTAARQGGRSGRKQPQGYGATSSKRLLRRLRLLAMTAFVGIVSSESPTGFAYPRGVKPVIARRHKAPWRSRRSRPSGGDCSAALAMRQKSAGYRKTAGFNKVRRRDSTPWMPGTRPGMTISFRFNNLRHGRACPGLSRPSTLWRNSAACSAQCIEPRREIVERDAQYHRVLHERAEAAGFASRFRSHSNSSKTLGLTMPLPLLGRADEVIE